MKLSEAQAIAIKLEYSALGYKNKSLRTVLREADKVISATAREAMQAMQETLCTKCWGDGFHRITESMLSGPCEECHGTGRREALSQSEDTR